MTSVEDSNQMESTSVECLTRHLFDLKLSIETFEGDIGAIALENVIISWSNLPIAMRKKVLAFTILISRLSKDDVLIVLQFILKYVEDSTTNGRCRLSNASSVFLLRCLDVCVYQTKYDYLNAIECISRLASCIEYSSAREIKLHGVPCGGSGNLIIKWNNYDSLRVLHFFPNVVADWSAFGKFLSEIKGGESDQIIALIPFLENFLAHNIAKPELVSIVDRMSRRNGTVASALILHICQCETFPEYFDLYLNAFEALVPSDNENVQVYISKISKIVPASSSMTKCLLKLFSTSSPKSRELISKFLADNFMNNLNDLPNGVPSFVDLASKELSNEPCLSHLVQCAALLSAELESFLVSNLKASQKLSVRSAILSGICLSRRMEYLSTTVLKEIFTMQILKDSLLAGSVQNRTFFICAFAAHIAHPEHEIDNLLLKDAIQNLLKPSGPAIFSDKGWALLDPQMLEIFVELLVLPVVYEQKFSQIQSICISAFVWLVINSDKDLFNFLKKRTLKIDCETAEHISISLAKYIDSSNISEVKANRVWTILNMICSSEAMKSKSLALVCHDISRFLGIGSGSWAELVRLNVSNINEFCQEQVHRMVDFNCLLDSANRKTSQFYLLETLISLSPNLVCEELMSLVGVEKGINELLHFSPAQWAIFSAKAMNNSAPAPLKSNASNAKLNIKSNPNSPNVDELALKESLLKLTTLCKRDVAVARATALALPYHANFTSIRPQLVVSLLEAARNVMDVEFRSFIVESVYEIASESMNGQGPLLVTLYLQVFSLNEHVDPSWSIPEETSLLDSVFNIIKLHAESSEILFAALVLASALKFKKANARLLFESQEFKGLLSSLKHLFENSESVQNSSILLDLVLSLTFVAPECSLNVQSSIVLLLVSIGEVSNLDIQVDSFLLELNEIMRRSNSACRLMIIKFLIAFVATHDKRFHCPELQKTIWLLHFKAATILDVTDPGDESDLLPEESHSYELNEVSMVASELFQLLQDENIEYDVLPELCLLETEKGEKELHVKNLLEHYIAALGASIKSSAQHLERISVEFKRLLSARTVPNGIVRLTKNVDRTKLDFTKQTRRALLRAIDAGSKDCADSFITCLIKFCFDCGFVDVDESDCEISFSTALSLVENCPETESERLYNQLSQCLESVPCDNDRIKVFSVILLGRASARAPSLTSSSSRVWDLINRIKESLDIPSEKVQKAVADTLVPLLRSQREDKRISSMTSAFAAKLRDASENYGSLRGSAFGLAAIFEACGTGLIRSHGLFSLLFDGLSRLNQKGSEAAVCSALAAIEIISLRCGTSFEPYISPLVPGVLEALGDSRPRVREDAEACADAMMAALSPLSVALILPPLLDMAGMASSDSRYSWRAKLGAVTWLGSMACLAPKVLTPALPRIIPALIVALTDTNEKVHLAAHHSLAVKYAAIIRSPEIKAALPAILRALSDPPRYASACLGDIIGTSFCHAVDGPSLALLEPLLSRALRERGTGAMSEAKRRAILIIANLGSLMDPAELRPYLDNLVPALRGVLGDAVPQVRSGAARALGILMRLLNDNGLAADCSVLVRIVPECLGIIFSTLSSVSAIDRAGAAQAIAQVTASRGLDPLIQLVHEHVAPILFTTTDDDVDNAPKKRVASSAREALLHLCAALPAAVPTTQLPQLYEKVFTRERILSILKGTGDEDEGVREISTKTIRSLLLRQALFIDLQAALNMLLRGTIDGRWRIRLACFTLLADILPLLSMDPDASICDTKNRTLSGETRARILSRLFFGRFDCNGLIRNASFSLWKSIVTHPPRVILEILPVLVDDCVSSLELIDEDEDGDEEDDDDDDEEYSDESEESDAEDDSMTNADASKSQKMDRYETASAALQDILVKLSDRILLPFLRRLVSVFAAAAEGKHEDKLPGVLLAARIVTSIVIVPNLIPPHLRGASAGPVVSVPRAQIDEALVLVLQLTKQGLLTQTENPVKVAVSLFARISRGLRASPVLMERIITDLFFESNQNEALISVLNRRPRILLNSLVNRFRKLSASDEIDWSWWTEVFEAPGPFLAPHAPSLITHALKLLNDQIEDHFDLFDVLLASMSAYDPDIYYGDDEDADYGDDNEDDDEDENSLEDSVESGLFSFGQILETLWSARNLPILAARLMEHFALGGFNGIDRFYDTWLDRLLVDVLSGGSEVSSAALERIIERAVERQEGVNVISNFIQCVDTRSVVSKGISCKLPPSLLSILTKTLTLPIITDANSNDRFEAARLLQFVLLGPGLIENCPVDNLTKGLSIPLATTLLGALIRCLSDRNDTQKTERLKAALLPILLRSMQELSSVAKPFYPQLARLGVNVLKDLIAAVSISGNGIGFDASHSRGQIALVTCKLVSLLLTQMSRVDVLIEELGNFRVIEEDHQIYDDLSTRNARRVLLTILKSVSTSSHQQILQAPLAAFFKEIIHQFMSLPSKEIELVRETASIGLLLADKLSPSEATEMKSFINNLI